MPEKRTNTDFEMLKGLKRGDHDCFRRLFDTYSSALYRFSVSYLKSNEVAEDVVQEVFLKIWNKRKDINTEKSFQSYLFTIALNVVRKYFNKLAEINQVKHDILIELAENKQRMDEAEDFQELLDKLEHFLEQMPEKRRAIFCKKKLEGKSLKEIAEEFDITTKTVEYHITEAMKFLKAEFEKLRIGGMVFFWLFLRPD
jgi:RNA polymerase sigma-70 factor (family 1)